MSMVLHFTGVVHPERANVNCSGLTYELSGGLRARLFLAIECSQVRVSVATEDAIDRTALKNSIQRFVARIVDCIGFTNGCGYDVELIQLVEGECGQVVYGCGYPVLQGQTVPVSFEDVLKATQGEHGLYLERALRDISDAIRRPYDSPFHCYRAIETIMQYFKFLHSLKDEKKGWEAMRAALQVDQSKIMSVKKMADLLRHGVGLNRLEDSDRDNAMQVTRQVIASFVAHTKRNAPPGGAS